MILCLGILVILVRVIIYSTNFFRIQFNSKIGLYCWSITSLVFFFSITNSVSYTTFIFSFRGVVFTEL